MSAAALRWNAILNVKKVGLGLVSVVDMYLFLDKGRTGGDSYISKRYSKTNNTYLKPDDPKKRIKIHCIFRRE